MSGAERGAEETMMRNHQTGASASTLRVPPYRCATAGRCTNADVEAMLRGVAPAMFTFLKDYICPKHILEDMVRSGAEPWATTLS